MKTFKLLSRLSSHFLDMNRSAKMLSGFSSPSCTYAPESWLKHDDNSLTYTVMVLNRPINYPVDFFIPFWNKAALRMTVDGGTNRWLSYLEQNNLSYHDISNIDVVCGDFDSIKTESLKGPELKHAEIIHTPDQNETDFTKALKELSTRCVKMHAVFVICQSSGRLDQLMANINTLYKCATDKFMIDAPIYLLSDDSLSWLIKEGESVIEIPNSLLESKHSWCALIAMGEKCENVSTTGLKWNLRDSTLEFGKLVSTSNQFDGSSSVRINSKSILLWSMNILPILSSLYGVSEEDKS